MSLCGWQEQTGSREPFLLVPLFCIGNSIDLHWQSWMGLGHTLNIYLHWQGKDHPSTSTPWTLKTYDNPALKTIYSFSQCTDSKSCRSNCTDLEICLQIMNQFKIENSRSLNELNTGLKRTRNQCFFFYNMWLPPSKVSHRHFLFHRETTSHLKPYMVIKCDHPGLNAKSQDKESIKRMTQKTRVKKKQLFCNFTLHKACFTPDAWAAHIFSPPMLTEAVPRSFWHEAVFTAPLTLN